MEEVGKSIVYLDKETIIPLRVGAPGVRFRISLFRWQVNKGVLPVYLDLYNYKGRGREQAEYLREKA